MKCTKYWICSQATSDPRMQGQCFLWSWVGPGADFGRGSKKFREGCPRPDLTPAKVRRGVLGVCHYLSPLVTPINMWCAIILHLSCTACTRMKDTFYVTEVIQTNKGIEKEEPCNLHMSWSLITIGLFLQQMVGVDMFFLCNVLWVGCSVWFESRSSS